MLRYVLRLAVVFVVLAFATNVVAQPPQDTLWTIASPTSGANLPPDMPITASGTIKTGATGGVLATYKSHPPMTGSPYYPYAYWEKVSDTNISISGNNWSASVALIDNANWPLGNEEMFLRVVPTGSTNAPATLSKSTGIEPDEGDDVVVDIVAP
jgi:hypothetical protein